MQLIIITAAESNEGSNTMFIMVSRCPERVVSQADRCLGRQFLHPNVLVYDVVVDHCGCGCDEGWGCCFGDNEGYIVGINI